MHTERVSSRPPGDNSPSVSGRVPSGRNEIWSELLAEADRIRLPGEGRQSATLRAAKGLRIIGCSLYELPRSRTANALHHHLGATRRYGARDRALWQVWHRFSEVADNLRRQHPGMTQTEARFIIWTTRPDLHSHWIPLRRT